MKLQRLYRQTFEGYKLTFSYGVLIGGAMFSYTQPQNHMRDSVIDIIVGGHHTWQYKT